jgi:hypothetical protein
MFDFDNGLETAVSLVDKYKALRYELTYDTYDDKDPFVPRAWLDAEKKLEQFQKQSARNALPFDTLIIDSLTGLAKCIQHHTMYVAMNDPFAKPQIQHYGTMVSAMEKVLTILRSTKCLLLVTAHEVNVEVDKSNKVRPLSITKAHGVDKLAWLFDEVLHMGLEAAGMGKYRYMASALSTSSILARTRSSLTEKVNVGEVGLAGLLAKIGYRKKGI